MIFLQYLQMEYNGAVLEGKVIGLKNARLLLDSYHSFNDIWPKWFGGTWTNQLSTGIKN